MKIRASSRCTSRATCLPDFDTSVRSCSADAIGVPFNDIVLAMAAGGLRELLLRYDGHADHLATGLDRLGDVVARLIAGYANRIEAPDFAA